MQVTLKPAVESSTPLSCSLHCAHTYIMFLRARSRSARMNSSIASVMTLARWTLSTQ